MSHAVNIDVIEYEACGDCLIAIANDDFSGMDDETENQVKVGISSELSSARKLHRCLVHFVADGDELGFTHDTCEICGALPGDRYRVNMLVHLDQPTNSTL